MITTVNNIILLYLVMLLSSLYLFFSCMTQHVFVNVVAAVAGDIKKTWIKILNRTFGTNR